MVLYYLTATAAEIDDEAEVHLETWVDELDAKDPVRQFILLMAEYAASLVLQHDSPYQHECEVYARSRLVPAQQFDLPRSIGDEAAARQLGIPVDQLVAHRADYGYDVDWSRDGCARWAHRPVCQTRRRRCHRR